MMYTEVDATLVICGVSWIPSGIIIFFLWHAYGVFCFVLFSLFSTVDIEVTIDLIHSCMCVIIRIWIFYGLLACMRAWSLGMIWALCSLFFFTRVWLVIVRFLVLWTDRLIEIRYVRNVKTTVSAMAQFVCCTFVVVVVALLLPLPLFFFFSFLPLYDHPGRLPKLIWRQCWHLFDMAGLSSMWKACLNTVCMFVWLFL